MNRLQLIAALLHVYIGWRLVPDLPGNPGTGVILAAWLVASALLMPYAFSTRRSASRRTADRLTWAGSLAMGSFSSLLVLTVVRDVALALLATAHGAWPALEAAALRTQSAAAAPLGAAVLTLVGLYNARRRPRVRDVVVPIAGLPAALAGFTVVQISDLHVGPTIRKSYVDAVVDAVNAAGADLVAITGDLVDGPVQRLATDTAPLARLVSRHGTYFVTGNHEYYSGVGPWITELRRLGVQVLLNEHVVLRHDGVSLVMAGVTDYTAHHYHASHRSDPAAALAGAPHDAGVRVLLAHQPLTAPAAAAAGYQLQLSGHTHGGQFFPWNLLVRFWQPFTAGLHRQGAMWVYTSRGTGYWGPPKRLLAPSEITRLRLVPA